MFVLLIWLIVHLVRRHKRKRLAKARAALAEAGESRTQDEPKKCEAEERKQDTDATV